MAISIKDPETDALARRLAAVTGEKITDAVRGALEQRLAREERRRDRVGRLDRVQAIVERYNRQPVVDPREPDEIIGYDQRGLP
jgi:antitoxin VapB